MSKLTKPQKCALDADKYDTYEKAVAMNRLIAELERELCKREPDTIERRLEIDHFSGVLYFITESLKEIRASHAADHLRPTKPAKPLCPKCGNELERHGKPDDPFWYCDTCDRILERRDYE